MAQTLPQRLYLLTYTVDEGEFNVLNLQGRGQLLRAGALAEMTLDGLLSAEGGRVVQRATAPPDDPFLAEVWHDVPAKKPKRWLQFVHPQAHMAELAVTKQLAEAGIISNLSQRYHRLGGACDAIVNSPDQSANLQKDVRNAVAVPNPVAIPVDVLAMTVLAIECEVTTMISWQEYREHKQKIDVLIKRFDTLVPGLRKALRQSVALSQAVRGNCSA